MIIDSLQEKNKELKKKRDSFFKKNPITDRNEAAPQSEEEREEKHGEFVTKLLDQMLRDPQRARPENPEQKGKIDSLTRGIKDIGKNLAQLVSKGSAN